MPPRVVGHDDARTRAAQRRMLGSLSSHRVSQKTYARYLDAIRRFVHWVVLSAHPVATDLDVLDAQVSTYIELLWSEGEGRSLAGDTLSAVGFFLHRRRILPAAWGLYSAWSRLELPNRAPPLPVPFLWAFCGVAVANNM